MNLPVDFLGKMKSLLLDDYEEFIKSYEEEKQQGLRVNTLKISIDQFLKLNSFTLNQIPWVKAGFFYSEGDRPGKHPYHEAGLYYIQEPSAMAVGEIMAAEPGEKVLDLCAAPGGKTTHLASHMNQSGLLVANEIHSGRARILSQNVERMGIRNAVVTNETPDRLAEIFPNFFDRILVDAPCSGEGMFRKDPDACNEWSLENVALCSTRQRDILQHAAKMLKAGGRLVYSTCTFSPEENEAVMSEFIKMNPSFEIEAVNVYEGFSMGHPDRTSENIQELEKTIRIWPHRVEGEGHYIAVLRKRIDHDSDEGRIKRHYIETIGEHKLPKEYIQFVEEALINRPQGDYLLFGDQLYIVPKEILSIKNLKVLRPGWHLGTIKKNRFEPSHALALSLRGEDVRYRWNLKSDSKEIMAYLRGESIPVDGPNGWTLVEVDGYSLGWGKVTQGVLKNHYPKGLRWMGN